MKISKTRRIVIQHEHHGNNVSVIRENIGKHRENCLCWQCDKFNPEDRESNCQIANELFSFDVKHGVTTPVWECPEYKDEIE